LNAPPLQHPIPNLNMIVFDIDESSRNDRNEKHGEDNVNRNSEDEIVHHITY